MELLDIITENNELTGQTAPRKQVHAEGLWHWTVHIYVFRKIGNEVEFLVHLRSPHKDRHPNVWATGFGGHIKAGSTMEDGLRDELEEEIGLNVAEHRLIEGEWHRRDTHPDREISKVYFIEFLGEVADLKFNDGEVQAVDWMSVDGIKNSMESKSREWASAKVGFSQKAEYLLSKI